MDRLVREEAHRCLPCAVETVLETINTTRVDTLLQPIPTINNPGRKEEPSYPAGIGFSQSWLKIKAKKESG